MVMPLTEPRTEPFAWDDTPRDLFRQSPERLIVTRLRQTDRELARFLREWSVAEVRQP